MSRWVIMSLAVTSLSRKALRISSLSCRLIAPRVFERLASTRISSSFVTWVPSSRLKGKVIFSTSQITGSRILVTRITAGAARSAMGPENFSPNILGMISPRRIMRNVRQAEKSAIHLLPKTRSENCPTKIDPPMLLALFKMTRAATGR